MLKRGERKRMVSSRGIRWLFVLMLMACFGHATYYFAQLPAVVPSHFGVSGKADAWSSRSNFVGIYVFTVSVCGIIFGTIGTILARMPVSLINLPHKDYWLSDERKDDTISFLSAFMLLFGAATLGLLLFTFHQAFRVSLGRIETLEYMPLCLGLYIAVSLCLTTWILVKFSRRPQQ